MSVVRSQTQGEGSEGEKVNDYNVRVLVVFLVSISLSLLFLIMVSTCALVLINRDLRNLVQTMQVFNVQLNHGITNHVELPYGFGVNATNYAPYVWRPDK